MFTSRHIIAFFFVHYCNTRLRPVQLTRKNKTEIMKNCPEMTSDLVLNVFGNSYANEK